MDGNHNELRKDVDASFAEINDPAGGKTPVADVLAVDDQTFNLEAL